MAKKYHPTRSVEEMIKNFGIYAPIDLNGESVNKYNGQPDPASYSQNYNVNQYTNATGLANSQQYTLMSRPELTNKQSHYLYMNAIPSKSNNDPWPHYSNQSTLTGLNHHTITNEQQRCSQMFDHRHRLHYRHEPTPPLEPAQTSNSHHKTLYQTNSVNYSSCESSIYPTASASNSSSMASSAFCSSFHSSLPLGI